jgi:hypothetical protein
MNEFLSFLGSIGTELYDLFVYAKRGKPDPEAEKELAARLIRKASDEAMRRELGGF